MITAQEAYDRVIAARAAREDEFQKILSYIVNAVCSNEIDDAIKSVIQLDSTQLRITEDALVKFAIPYGENEFSEVWLIYRSRVINVVVEEIQKFLEKFGYEVVLGDNEGSVVIFFHNPQGFSGI